MSFSPTLSPPLVMESEFSSTLDVVVDVSASTSIAGIQDSPQPSTSTGVCEEVGEGCVIPPPVLRSQLIQDMTQFEVSETVHHKYDENTILTQVNYKSLLLHSVAQNVIYR